jgi:glycosyltransferase involved in cell wall biosynthesis
MRVSKHHYALEMASQGNQVYFIEPPRLENSGINVRRSGESDSLFLVSYKPVFRGKRFLPAIIFRAMLRWQIKLLIKEIGKKPDLVLCFHPFLFEELNWFKSNKSIYFAADLVYSDEMPPEVFSADFCLAVSDTIHKKLSLSGKTVYLIQHGLNRHFANTATELLRSSENIKKDFSKEPLKVGYTGNLLMGGMDRQTMRKVIEANPGVKFIFWGQYDLAGGNFTAGLNEEITGFVDFLKASSNVELRGAVKPEVLSLQMSEADVFWICWKIGNGKIWDGSNSHKLMEYLSTGKPVISHYVSSYKDSDILDMLPDVSNENYVEHFGRVLNRVRAGENIESISKRINFALSNTYEKQIDRIESWINDEKTA